VIGARTPGTSMPRGTKSLRSPRSANWGQRSRPSSFAIAIPKEAGTCLGDANPLTDGQRRVAALRRGPLIAAAGSRTDRLRQAGVAPGLEAGRNKLNPDSHLSTKPGQVQLPNWCPSAEEISA